MWLVCQGLRCSGVEAVVLFCLENSRDELLVDASISNDVGTRGGINQGVASLISGAGSVLVQASFAVPTGFKSLKISPE